MTNNKQDSLKILQLCLSPNKGGLEIYVTKLVKFLKQQVQVFVVIADDNNIKPYLDTLNNSAFEIKRSVFSASKLAKIIDKNQIDIIHLHWTKDLPIAVIAKMLSKKKPKLIQTRHMGMTQFKNDFYHRFLYQRMDLMIAITQEVKKQVEKFINGFNRKTKMIFIGTKESHLITASELKEIKNQYDINAEFVLGIVGRVEEQKGQHIVIDAFSQIIKQGVDAQLLIIGETTIGEAKHEVYLSKLKNNINKNNLNQKVVFTGFCNNVDKIIQTLDVLILATKKETFGMVLVEAMHAGVAVVASNLGGPTEIIDNNKNGLLFKSFDSDDLALKLKKITNDTKFRLTLAQNGKKKAQKVFAENEQFNQVLSAYIELANTNNV